MEPLKRLGSGAEGTKLSFSSLKQHKFFKGYDFQEVLKTDPPLNPDLMLKLKSEKKSFAGFDSQIELEPTMEAPYEETKRKNSIGDQHSAPKEGKTIKEGIVDKKCGWLFYRNRKLILTSAPRLSYYEPKTNKYKVLC